MSKKNETLKDSIEDLQNRMTALVEKFMKKPCAGSTPFTDAHEIKSDGTFYDHVRSEHVRDLERMVNNDLKRELIKTLKEHASVFRAAVDQISLLGSNSLFFKTWAEQAEARAKELEQP